MANQVNRVNSNENERENIKKVGEHVILNSNEKIDWTKEKAKKHLSVNWTNPNSFVSFLGIQRIENFYNKVLNKLEIKNVLSTIDSYSLMKQTPAHQKKKGNKFFSTSPHDVYMCDSVFFSEIKDFNYGIEALFCTIDCFSRFVWVEPMKNLSAESGIQALIQVFIKSGQMPHNLGE